MIDVKTVASGFAIAGGLGLAALGLGSGVASADPAPFTPQVSANQDGGGHAQAAPSPYAAYGDSSICGTPGMYFVNVCT